MAVGIEQVAGPVNAGDIIMRNEEAPRGAAALLNKMINKGTQGMYKLPEQDKEMPGFMKDAIKESEQAAVDPSDFRTILRILEAGGNPEEYMEQVKLDASDFRTILKLLEQGFSMDDIESMTQAKMTKNGPTKGLTMKDIANLDQAAVQGGKINFLGEQPEVKAPIRAKSHMDAPETQLAYITDAEKDLLVKANIHGSMDGKPNPGPAGIESLDDFYTYVDPKGNVQIGGGGGEEVFQSGVDNTGMNQTNQQTGASGDGGSYQSSEAVGVDPGMAVTNPFDDKGNLVGAKVIEAPAFTGEPSVLFQTGSTDSTTGNKALDLLNKEIANLEKDKELSKEEETRLKGLYERRFNILGGKTQTGESKIKTDDEEEDEENSFEKILSLLGPLKFLKPGDPILAFNEAQQKRVDQLLKDYNVKEGGNIIDMLKDFKGGKGQFYRDDGTLTREGFVKAMRSIDMGDGASALETLKRDQAMDYYNKMGVPQTSQGIDELAGKAMINKPQSELTADEKAYNRKIVEARMMRDRDRDSSKSTGGGGGGGTTPADTTPDTTPDPDPRAGQFNVGGTMPYTDDRTGNVEQFVPLGRRFQLTKDGKFRGSTPFTMDDVMKYATQGGFQQLEPFQEYLARRKKFLGEEDPEYFDEEGNVIYGGVA